MTDARPDGDCMGTGRPHRWVYVRALGLWRCLLCKAPYFRAR